VAVCGYGCKFEILAAPVTLKFILVTFWVADGYLLARSTFESKVLDIAGMPRFHKFSDKYRAAKEHFYSRPEMSRQYLWHRKNSEVVFKRDLSSVRSNICTILVTP